MIVTYKYKFYNSKHNRKLYELSQIARWIYNHCIALQRRYYKLYGGYISKYKMQKHISKLRKRNSEWLKLGSQTVQMITHTVDDAYQRFFKKLAQRPPKFKKYHNNLSFCFTQAGYKLKENNFTINSINKTFRFFKSREYENVKRIRIKQDKVGDWFLYLTIDRPTQNRKSGNAALGLDFGLKTFIVCSDGTKIEHPQFLSQSLIKLRKSGRNFSKTKRSSNNRQKRRVELARLHRKISNQRRDFQFKLAHSVCKKANFVAIEDLNIKGMAKLWGRKVSDLSWSSFVEILEHVAKKYDCKIQKIDGFFPSSKLCECGEVNKDLKLSDRVWACSSCGSINERDLLAAKNILTEGIRLYRTKCQASVLEAV